MRIAVFIKSTTFHKNYGGLETQNKILCEGLAARGHQITVFSPAKELSAHVREESGVKFIFIPCVYRMLLASVDKNNWYNKSYKEFLKFHTAEPFDLVISQSSAGLGVINRKTKLGTKIIGISHGTIGGEMKTLVNSAKKPLDALRISRSLIFGLTNFFGRQRQYIHGCDKIVAVSTAVKDAIIRETYAPEEKITVIQNGTDSSTIPQKDWGINKPGEPFKILYIGRIEESKGLGELLLACKDLSNLFLNIVGEGPYLDQLKKLSRYYKMSQKILFYGKLPYEKAIEMYSWNDLFVLPTKRVEGLPMTLIEASFAGLPIITTDIGGNRDVVENQKNGFLINNPDVDKLKNLIEDLKNDRKRAEEMGINGRIIAENNFSLKVMLDKYENLADSI